MTQTPAPILESAYPEKARPTLLAANGMYLLAGAGVLLQYAFFPQIARLLRALFGEMTAVEALLGIDALLYPLFFLLPVAAFIARRGAGSMRLSGISPGMTFVCLLAGPVFVLLSGAVSFVWLVILNALGLPVAGARISIANERELLLGVVAIAIIPGIFEEFLFRGPILSAYEKGGARRAILISGILFAMLHGSVEGLPIQFIMGVALGYAVVSTGSIYAGMMIHTSFNASQILLSYAAGNAVSQTGDGAPALEGTVESVALAITATLMGLVALGLVSLIVRAFRRYRTRAGIALFPAAPLKPGVGEAIVLISGVVTALFLYANNIFGILEYLL